MPEESPGSEAESKLSQGSYVLAELALQIGRLVFVDHVFLGQLVDHRDYLGEQLRGFGLVRTQTQFLDGVTGRFVVVTVAQTFFIVGTDTLDGRFVVCHFIEINFVSPARGLVFSYFAALIGGSWLCKPVSRKAFVARRGIEPLFQE